MAAKEKDHSATKALKYIDTLPSDVRQRYSAKTKLIGGHDPYEIDRKKWTFSLENPEILPSVQYPDIVNYLLFTPSPYTSEDLKCYKGLDAYNQFVCGWVRDVQVCLIEDFSVLKAKVRHSQKMNDKPLVPWIISETNGKIIASHCTCMAGLGETCTHVAALLFAVASTVDIRDSKTCTQSKAYWLLPTGVKDVKYLPVSEIDFSSAKTKKKKLDANIAVGSVLETKVVKKQDQAGFSPEQVNKFYEDLNMLGEKCAILSLIEPFSNNYAPVAVQERFPLILTELRDEKCLTMNFKHLLDHCQSIEIKTCKEEIENVERATREQSLTKTWFRFRAGRITASKLSSVCKTNECSPSQSLIKSICYPEQVKFASKATIWGCEHEKIAKSIFQREFVAVHENAEVRECGFIIDEQYPYIGASPDGLITCDCCGTACLEIKCPYCERDKSIEESLQGKGFCLEKVDDTITLKKEHPYYYQVQTQMYVTKHSFAYFVLWTTKELHIELIRSDPSFISDKIPTLSNFFSTSILPELVGKFFSRLPNTNSVLQSCENHNAMPIKKYCYCGCDEDAGKMIGCDNEKCELEWFHLDCLRLKRTPKGKWYCPECRKLSKFRRGKAF